MIDDIQYERKSVHQPNVFSCLLRVTCDFLSCVCDFRSADLWTRGALGSRSDVRTGLAFSRHYVENFVLRELSNQTAHFFQFAARVFERVNRSLDPKYPILSCSSFPPLCLSQCRMQSVMQRPPMSRGRIPFPFLKLLSVHKISLTQPCVKQTTTGYGVPH